MLAPLDNETIFKKAFTDKIVFKQFVKDIFNIDFEVDKIETEKRFEPQIGSIDVEFDIFAESADHRFVVEIQKVDYDYNFDRFLNYFCTAIIELQKSYQTYKLNKTVYSVVVITADYVIRNGKEIKDDVLITNLNPRTLKGVEKEIYGHKQIFLNPSYINADTPQSIKDWLTLFYESIKNPSNPQINRENVAIKRVIDLIDENVITPSERKKMKESESRKITKIVTIENARNEEKYEIAKDMIINAEPIEKIVLYTKLSKETIEKLINELKNK